MLCLSIVQVLCNLASVVLELLRLDEICVPLEVPVHVVHNLALPHDVLQHRLAFELFLREDVSHCKALLLRTFLGVDRRLLRLVLDSVFHSSPGPSRQFQIARQSRCSVRFTRLRLCVSVVLTIVTSVSIDTRHLCLLDAAVRHLKCCVLHRLNLVFYLCNLFLFDLNLQ